MTSTNARPIRIIRTSPPDAVIEVKASDVMRLVNALAELNDGEPQPTDIYSLTTAVRHIALAMSTEGLIENSGFLRSKAVEFADWDSYNGGDAEDEEDEDANL